MTSYLVIIIAIVNLVGAVPQDEDLSSTVKFLQEQLNVLLEHRQEDYNALEASLKQSMEKNTELLLLRNEVKSMRYVFDSFSFCIYTILFDFSFYR